MPWIAHLRKRTIQFVFIKPKIKRRSSIWRTESDAFHFTLPACTSSFIRSHVSSSFFSFSKHHDRLVPITWLALNLVMRSYVLLTNWNKRKWRNYFVLEKALRSGRKNSNKKISNALSTSSDVIKQFNRINIVYQMN